MQEPIIGRDATIEFSTDGEKWNPAGIATGTVSWKQALATTRAPGSRPWTREPRHTTSRHLRAVRLWRMRQILRQMPRDAAPAERLRWSLHVAALTATLGRRQLARVVWPWQPRQDDASPRTPRGRLTNPTALR